MLISVFSSVLSALSFSVDVSSVSVSSSVDASSSVEVSFSVEVSVSSTVLFSVVVSSFAELCSVKDSVS